MAAFLAGASTLILAEAPGAQAQQASQQAEEDRVVEEILVTARRREERLQDVPMSLTSFSGLQLEKRGAQDITYLNHAIPNVTIERSRSTNSTLTAFIRGVGQQDPVAGFEQGVGIYIDDVYINRPQGAVLDIYDIERIEVLRGPQGTLYGRNTIGGAIKYVSKRLGPEPEFSLRVNGGTFTQFDAFMDFGLPITDSLRFGGAIARMTRDGFGTNLVQQGVDNYNKDVLAGRMSLEWTPTPDWFIRIAGDWTDDESDPRQGHRLIPDQFPPMEFPVLDNEFDTRADLDNPQPLFVINRGVSFLAEWNVNETVTIKNILAYRDNKSNQQIDFDSLPVVDFQAPFTLADDQFSEEFQVLFDTGTIDGILGFYYLNADAFNAFDGLLGLTGDLIGLPGLNAFTEGRVETDTWSIFGDVTIDLAEMFDWYGPNVSGLELSVGGRFTRDQRSARVLRQTFIGGNSPTFGGNATLIATTSDFQGTETFEDFTPRISLAWQPVDEHNIYFSFSQGFKGGGFDPRGATTGTPDFNNDGTISDDEVFEFMKFDPEEITTYEVGAKSSFMNGRANTSLAVFYSDFKNVQIPGSVGLDTDGDGVDDDFAGITTNAGAASFFGIEFEGSWLMGNDIAAPGDAFTAVWALGWIDAEFDRFIVPVTDPDTGQTSLQNVAEFLTVQNTPEWNANVTLTYSQPFRIYDEPGEVSLITSYSYRGATNQFEFDSPIDEDGYFLLDASLVWTSDSGTWEVGIHGKNLTDTRYKIAGYDFFTGPTGVPGIATPVLGLEGTLTAFFGNPRTVTGTVGLRF